MIAERRQPALIVVHTKELLNQWIHRIETFLGIPHEEIRVIGNGSKTRGKRVTVGIVNSVYKIAGEIAPFIGHVIEVDTGEASHRRGSLPKGLPRLSPCR